MKETSQIQLSLLSDESGQDSFLAECRKIFLCNYRKNSFRLVGKCYQKIKKLFDGKFSGYRKCTTSYHNFLHTEEVFLTSARLVDGYNLSNFILPEQLAINVLVAALFHDTGYIQEEDDVEGTGAKYTQTHVDRSIDFLFRHYSDFGITEETAEIISRLIKSTDINIPYNEMKFESYGEKIAAAILATSDILGQMSSRVYLEKLLFLYYEFREAGIPGYASEFDILLKTRDFYDGMKKRLADDLMDMGRFARDHFRERYSVDSNVYFDSIEKNMNYLGQIIDDTGSNFRHKLKRGNLIDQADSINQHFPPGT